MNNKMLDNSKARFSLRKLSVGLVSMLLGFTFYVTTNNAESAKAAEIPSTTEETTQNNISNYDNTSTSNEAKSFINKQDNDLVTKEDHNASPNNINTVTSNNVNTNTDNTSSNKNSNNTKEDAKSPNITQDQNSTTTSSNNETTNQGSASSNSQINNSNNNTNGDANNVASNQTPDKDHTTPPVHKLTRWNDIPMSYDEATHTLTIEGGNITDPEPLAKNVDKYQDIKEIVFKGKLTIYGDAIGMLANLSSLTKITNLSNLDTTNVTNMDYFFDHDINLISLDLSKFKTDNVNSMNNMFAYCKQLTELDLSNFNTAKVQFMMHMFEGTDKLTTIDLSSFNTSNVADMSYMFNKAIGLTNLDLSKFDTSNVEFMMHMFDGAKSLTALDLSSFDTHNIADMSYMFANMTNLHDLNIASFDTSNVEIMMHMFDGAQQLTNLDLSHFNTAKVTDMSYMFNGMNALTKLDISNFNTKQVTYFMHMFDGIKQLTSLDLTNFDTSSATDMSYMFHDMPKLTNINLTSFNTTNVIYLMHMFDGDTSLKNLDLTSFDTPQAKDLSYLFNNCSSLLTIKMPKLNLTNAEYINNMFSNCTKLIEVDTSNFGTNKAISMSNMFSNCTSLTKLNLNKFTTANTYYMANIFNNCINLEELHIKSFDLSKAVDASGMLANLPKLRVLELGEALVLNNTGLNTPGKWRQVAQGTIDKPEGKTLYTSDELMKFYNGKLYADTYVKSNLPEQTIKIEYRDLDDHNKVILTDSKNCATGLITIYHDALEANLNKLKEQNYLYDKANSNLPLNSDNDILIDKLTDTSTYIIGLRHKKIHYNAGENNPITNQNDDANLIKEVKQVIKYNAPQPIPDHVQTIRFSRTGIADLVANTVTYSDWDKSNATFDDVTSPSLAHYSPDINLVKGETVTPGDNDIVKTVTYIRIPENNLTINFIDRDNNNLPIKEVESIQTDQNTVGKPINQSGKLKDTLDKLDSLGYDIYLDPLADPIVAIDGNQTITYIMKHRITNVSDSKEFHITTNFVDQDDKTISKADVQTITISRTGKRDEVTKDTDWSSWQTNKKPNNVKVPVVNGYLADKAIVDYSQVKDYDKDITTNVIYHKLGNFIPVDANGKTIENAKAIQYQNDPDDPTKVSANQKLPDIAGYQTPKAPKITDPFADTKVVYDLEADNSLIIDIYDEDTAKILNDYHWEINDAKLGDPVSYDWKAMKQKLLDAGYDIVTEPDIPTNYQEKNQKIIIKVKHRQTDTSENKKIDITTNFIDQDGKTISKADVQTITISRTGKHDEVTKETKWSDWQAETPNNVKVPVINGYLTDKKVIDYSQIKDYDKDIATNVIYHKLGNFIPVDANGKTIENAKAIQYQNDPDDPTKVSANQKLPDIAGYQTPKAPKITDPFADTKVVYDLEADNSLIIDIYDEDTAKILNDYHWEINDVKLGDPVSYDWKAMKQKLLDAGYDIIAEPDIPANYQEKNQKIIIKVKHRQITLDPSNPPKEDATINQNGTKYPDKSEYDRQYKYTLNLVDNKGNKLADSIIQTVRFTRKLTIDAVTGKIIKADEWSTNQKYYDAIKLPVMNGYQSATKTNNGVDITNNMLSQRPVSAKDISDTLVYTPVTSVPDDNSSNNTNADNNQESSSTNDPSHNTDQNTQNGNHNDNPGQVTQGTDNPLRPGKHKPNHPVNVNYHNHDNTTDDKPTINNNDTKLNQVAQAATRPTTDKIKTQSSLPQTGSRQQSFVTVILGLLAILVALIPIKKNKQKN